MCRRTSSGSTSSVPIVAWLLFLSRSQWQVHAMFLMKSLTALYAAVTAPQCSRPHQPGGPMMTTSTTSGALLPGNSVAHWRPQPPLHHQRPGASVTLTSPA